VELCAWQQWVVDGTRWADGALALALAHLVPTTAWPNGVWPKYVARLIDEETEDLVNVVCMYN
jgi:hypothetical protein